MDVLKRLKEIKNENIIWIIYIGIIALSYYSNYLEKNYFLNNEYKGVYSLGHIQEKNPNEGNISKLAR